MKAEVGFFQSELPSGKISNSTDRLYPFIILVVLMLIILWGQYTGKGSDMSLNVVLLVAIFAPKGITKIAELKYGIKADPDKEPEKSV